MNNHIIKILSGVSVLAVSACSTGSTGGSNTSTRVYSSSAGTAAVALDDGKTLVAQNGNTVAASLNYDTNETELTDASFKIRKNADGELTYTVNGVERAFTSAERWIESDGQVYGYQIEAGGVNGHLYTGLYNFKRELDQSLDTTSSDYLQVWGYQSNEINATAPSQSAQPDVAGYAVVGTETRSAALSGMPMATYSGRARIDTRPNSGFSNNNTDKTRNRANVSMTADFGAGTMSGLLTDITMQTGSGTEAPVAGSITMNSSTINGNSYSGMLTADGAFTAASGVTIDPSSTYSGSFYGPAAEQTGGGIALTGSDASGDFNGIGYFTGDKN